MSSQNSYFKLIKHKIEATKTAVVNSLEDSQLEVASESISYISTDVTQTSHTISDPGFSLIDEKDQYREWHKFALQIFFSKFSHIKLRTKKDYLKIIKDFIEHSPDLNPEDLESFMEHKFKISDQENEYKAPYSKNQAKYAQTIKRFLENVYSIGKINVDIAHYKKKTKQEKDQYPIITHNDVQKAYYELINNSLIQNAIILQTIYTLAIDPYTLCLLTYEGLQEEGYIKYYDHKLRDFKLQRDKQRSNK